MKTNLFTEKVKKKKKQRCKSNTKYIYIYIYDETLNDDETYVNEFKEAIVSRQ